MVRLIVSCIASTFQRSARAVALAEPTWFRASCQPEEDWNVTILSYDGFR